MGRRRLAAILAVDIVDYSRMMQLDSSGLVQTLNKLFTEVVRPAVETNEGRIVKLMGDGAIIEFPAAALALEAAVEIQTNLRRSDSPYVSPEPIRLRAGLHAGDVVEEGNDIFGDGVNIAARLESAAEPGGILASRMFCDLAGSSVSVSLQRRGSRSLKGIAQPIEVLSVEFEGAESRLRREQYANEQVVHFCKSKDGVGLAWVENGSGPPIIKAPSWIGHLKLDWRNPGIAPVITSIAHHYRLVRFDARGNGLSDWEVDEISFERFVDDLEAVFDAAGIERAPILAISQGSAVATAFAVRNPDRVSAIIMIGGFPLGRAKRKSAKDRERAEAMRSMMAAGWDDDYPSLRDLLAEIIVPTASVEERRQYAQDMKLMISPENIGRYRGVVDYLDVTDLLPKVSAPCLVLNCQNDRMQPIDQGRLLASGLSNSRFISYDSPNHTVPESDPEWPRMERDILSFLAEHTA
jgi:class 3 adenylate cyclase/pimeloyl-ACP methyl ester carboxylesterase